MKFISLIFLLIFFTSCSVGVRLSTNPIETPVPASYPEDTSQIEKLQKYLRLQKELQTLYEVYSNKIHEVAELERELGIRK